MNRKYVDLHLHIDGSLNIAWMYERAKKRKVIPEDMPFTAYYKTIIPDGEDIEAVFKRFDVPLAIMQCEEDIHDACYELLKEICRDNVIYAELRFAPQLHTREGLSQEDALRAAIRGINDAMDDYPIKANILVALMHQGDGAAVNEKENMESLLLAEKYLGKGVCGLDLAGFENSCDLNEYAPLFMLAREKSIPFTIHAGEMGNAENVHKALMMGADRIGHGINAVSDEKILAELVKTQIPLEICATSNLYFGYTYASHPIHELLRRGCKIVICTDDMSFVLNNMAYEFNMLNKVGISDDMLDQFTLNAIAEAFISDEEKEKLRKQLKVNTAD